MKKMRNQKNKSKKHSFAIPALPAGRCHLPFAIYLLLFAFLLLLPQAKAYADVPLYFDDFTDGDYVNAEGANGLSWEVFNGTATVTNGWLGVVRGGSGIVTIQQMPVEYTLETKISQTWSNPGRIIFLYQDPQNYYSLNIGGNRGVYRVMDGVSTKLSNSTYDFFYSLTHSSSSQETFKIYVYNDGTKITIKIDRGGYTNGIDYELEVIDTDQLAVLQFVKGKIGIKDEASLNPGSWFKIDYMTVYPGLKFDQRPRPVAVFYVDGVNGSDSNPGTEVQPWKTIQEAANTAMAGDTVLIAPGIYREGMIVPQYTGAEGYPIIYKALDSQNPPVIQGTVKLDAGEWQQYDANIYKTQINWLPLALYIGETPLFIAQEPNQLNPDDQMELEYFRQVPFEENNVPEVNPKIELVDSSFFTQPDDFWNNATLLIYDGYGNAIGVYKILDYIGSEHKVVYPENQWRKLTDKDKYALRNHLSILDKPGEWVIDTTTTPYTLYVWPYDGYSIEDVEISKYDRMFDLSQTYKYNEYLVIDGLEIKFYQGNALSFNTSYGSDRNCIVRNCDIHHNMGSGVYGRFQCDGLRVEDCKLHNNYGNGVSFGGGRNYVVENNEIYENLDNGIWAGTGGDQLYYVQDIIIRGNYIHHQGSARTHPDNIQLYKTNNVVVDGNYLVQEGHQNTWFSYNGVLYITNNIFLNGTVGINSATETYVYNNVFYKAGLRYDAWQNDPNYSTKKAVIGNNVIIESGISMPPETLWSEPLWPGMTFDHNFYCITNNWLLSSWRDTKAYGKHSIVDNNLENLNKYFVNSPADFHSISESPLIDAGNNFLYPNIQNDLDGNARFKGDAIDIGPYESDSPFVLPEYLPDPEEPIIKLPPPPGVYIEDFDSRFSSSPDFSEKKYPYGLSWEIVRGVPTLSLSMGGKYLSVSSTSPAFLMVAKEGSQWQDIQFSLQIGKSWTGINNGFVMLYKDPENFYFFNIRTGSLLKRQSSTDTTIGTNAALSLAHGDNDMHTYVTQITINGTEIEFKIKKDSMTEPIVFNDASPHVKNGTIGLIRDTGTLKADNIRVEVTGIYEYVYGDVNGDGEISAYDAALTAQAAVDLITLTPEQTKAADVSGDGEVTAYDAALIAQRAVGLIDKFPVEG